MDCVSLLKLSGTCAPGARISKGCSGYMTPSCLASCQSSSMSDDAKPDRGQLIEILLLLIQRECCLSVPLHLLQLHLFQTSRLTAGSFSFPIPPSRLPPFRNLKGFRDPIRKWERESAGSWRFKPDGICSLNTIPLQSDTALILHFSSRLFCCCQHKPIPNKIPAYGYGGHKIHNEVQNGAGGPGLHPQAGRFWPTGSMFDTPNLTPSHCTSGNDVKACRTGHLPHQFSDLQAADCHLKHWCAPCCTRWWRMTAELTVHAHHYTL